MKQWKTNDQKYERDFYHYVAYQFIHASGSLPTDGVDSALTQLISISGDVMLIKAVDKQAVIGLQLQICKHQRETSSELQS